LSYYVATRGGKLIGDEPVGVCGFSDSVMIAAAACPAHGDGFLFFHPLAGTRLHSGKKRSLSFFAGTLCEWAAESRSHLGAACNLIEARC
jgi:hypothetical protein